MTTNPQLTNGDRQIVEAVETFLINSHSAIEKLNERIADAYHVWPTSVRPNIGSRSDNAGSNVDRTISRITDVDDALERITFRRQAVHDLALSGNKLCQWAAPQLTDDHPRCFEGSQSREGFAHWGDPQCTTWSEHADGGPCSNHARYERNWRRSQGLADRRKKDAA